MNETPDSVLAVKSCAKCSSVISGQFVRASKSLYHLDCFRCHDCDQKVADKFFTNQDSSGTVTGIYCEQDYFKRMELSCARCGQALRGTYIKQGNNKFHLEHFSCVVCDLKFQPEDSYYERDGEIYCQKHYSSKLAQKCGGCDTVVMKNFVLTEKEETQQWHPCCYMLYKQWNLRVADSKRNNMDSANNADAGIEEQQDMVEKVEKLLKILYNFEESSAEAISGMLVECLSGNNLQGGLFALKLISHIELLINALQQSELKKSEITKIPITSHPKEAKLIAKKIPQFFGQLRNYSNCQDKQEFTKQMIQMVSEIANVLKYVMRKILTAGFFLEQNFEYPDLFNDFLDKLDRFHEDDTIQTSHMISLLDDKCISCVEILRHEKNLRLEKYVDGLIYLICNQCEQELSPRNYSLDCTLHNSQTPSVLPPQLYMVMICQSYYNFLAALNINPAAILKLEKQEDEHEDFAEALRRLSVDGPEGRDSLSEDEEAGSNLVRSHTIRKNTQTGVKWNVNKNKEDNFAYLTDITGLEAVSLRPAAALALNQYFSEEILRGISETPKKSVWPKIFRKNSKKQQSKYEKSFGTPLHVLIQNRGTMSTDGYGMTAVRIPIIVQECISQLKQQDLTVEGIFRKNGNIRRLRELVDEIDTNPFAVDLHDDDPILIAALLKKFLRELPEPLIIPPLYQIFVAVPSLQGQQRQLEALHLLLCLLPNPNLHLLSVLVKFLAFVTTFSTTQDPKKGNKMDAHNLAMVMAPNILYSISEHSPNSIEVVKLLIEHSERLFKTPEIIKSQLNLAEDE